jgi:XcyI restriction endonuclease
MEIQAIVPESAQQLLAQVGIRDEEVFPLPAVLHERPTLVGYYRLLLGSSQKQFYASGSGLSPFKAMEMRGTINSAAEKHLEEFCRTMSLALAELIDQISPRVTQQDIEQLPLLTLGSQLQGSNNNLIGKVATEGVFLAIRQIVSKHISKQSSERLVVQNSAGRDVHIQLSADPDVRFEEIFGHDQRPRLAIEIKGGTDKSNAHNRAGEAEKSHQKAKALGYPECWTVIATEGLQLDVLRGDSPTTTQWFDSAQILGREGEDWEEFKTRIVGIVGIPE